jgi:hypothetical protein
MSYIGSNAQGLISNIDGGTIKNATLDSSVTFPPGSIVQVESTQFGSGATMTSMDYHTDYVVVDGTAGDSNATEILTVELKPKFQNSKIWLQVSWCGEVNPTSISWNMMFFIYRNSTKLQTGTSSSSSPKGIHPIALSYNQTDADSTMESSFFQYFDTPNTTDNITYKLGINNGSTQGSIATSRTITDGGAGYERGVSSIVAIEIKQ